MTAGTVVLVNASGVRSGAENVLADVARYLIERGWKVVLLSPPGPIVEAFPSNVSHVAIPTLGLEGRGGSARLIGVALVLTRWIRAGRILRSVAGETDPVVVNSLFGLPILGWAFPARRGSGTVSWLVHDTVVSRKQRLAVRLGAGRLDFAVAVSEVTGESIRDLIRRVRVRPNGVAVREGDVVPAAEREPVIGILAALTPWKGHEVLLEAVALIPHVTLEIAGGALPGEEGYAQALLERAERSDLRGRVRFLGHVDRSRVLDRWSIAVSASVLPEAGPLGVLECMAAGLPVVASNHGGAAEYLAGGAGILVPPGDPRTLASALEWLLADPADRDRLAGRARARVGERYDLGATLPAMVEALTEA